MYSVSTSANAVYVAAYIDVKSSFIEQGIDLLLRYREAARRQPGNLSVDLLQEIARPNRFVTIEAWQDQSSFEAHEKTDRIVQFRNQLNSIHSNPRDQRMHNGFAIDSESEEIPQDTICVVTHVDVPPPRKDEAEVLLKRLAAQSRRDAGNIRYDIFQQTPPRTNHFTVFAIWKDADAFDSHETKPHRLELREALWPILGAPYDERLYKPLGGSGRSVVSPG